MLFPKQFMFTERLPAVIFVFYIKINIQFDVKSLGFDKQTFLTIPNSQKNRTTHQSFANPIYVFLLSRNTFLTKNIIPENKQVGLHYQRDFYV